MIHLFLVQKQRHEKEKKTASERKGKLNLSIQQIHIQIHGLEEQLFSAKTYR